jgi:hypothetical protein
MFMKAPEPPKPEQPEATQGGIDPAMLAQAAAMNPQDIAAGGMQPPMPPQGIPQAPPVPQRQPTNPAAEINPITGQPYSPQMQAELARIEQLRED